MEYRLLEYFLAVCEELHFTRAAEKLGISQPTLSQQIRLLENRVGLPLFHRIGKKTHLSEAGHILRKHSINAFHELEQAMTAIGELKGMQRGTLRIGCSGNHLMIRTLIAFHSQYPGIDLSVTELATEETKEGLLNNQLDVGVVFLPPEDDDLVCIPLYTEELQLLVSDQLPIAQAASVSFMDLRQLPLLTLQSKYYVRQLFDQYCAKAGFTIQPILELSTLESLVEMAKHGVGGAILPKSYVSSLSDLSIRCLPIVDPVPQKTVGAVYRKEKYISTVMDTFLHQVIRDLKE